MQASPAAPQTAKPVPQPELSRTDFEIIEGVFHDGLGTFAEVSLANELIALAGLSQPAFDTAPSKAKMLDAINRLPASHPHRAIFQREVATIQEATRRGAAQLLEIIRPARLAGVRHTPRDYADAKAGDIRLELAGGGRLPVSVKTDKSGKVAIAEGQTPHIGTKWAERYFRVSAAELDQMMRELGFSSLDELKVNYLNVARLVARVLIGKLGLEDCRPDDFSRARVTDMEALKYLLRQLVKFKKGSDGSRVIIFDRETGEVKWESLLEGIDIESLASSRVSFLPSRPRNGHPVSSEFGVRIDGMTVVTFQVKHRRGLSRGTSRQHEFSDITTRLRL